MTQQEQTFEAAAAEGLGHLTRVFGSLPVTPAEGSCDFASTRGT